MGGGLFDILTYSGITGDGEGADTISPEEQAAIDRELLQRCFVSANPCYRMRRIRRANFRDGGTGPCARSNLDRKCDAVRFSGPTH